MLRPSRPMMRPFMSSEGSSTRLAVVSAAWLAATRWSASPTSARARRFASACASSSAMRTMRASSWRTSSSERSSISRFASSTDRPLIRSSSASCASFARASSTSSSSHVRLARRRTPAPCALELVEPTDGLLLLGDRALLRLDRRPRGARSAPPARPRGRLSASSRTSTCASRRIASAERASPRRVSARSPPRPRCVRGRSRTREPTMAPTTSAGGDADQTADDNQHSCSYVRPVGTAVSESAGARRAVVIRFGERTSVSSRSSRH